MSINVELPTEAGLARLAPDKNAARIEGAMGGLRLAIAEAKDPVMMARAMKCAVEAGRLAYLSGRMGKRRYADPSSPLAGLI